jgi:hypothetical protein
MQAVIDLNARQASRVLEQATRTNVAIEIEPRSQSSQLLKGRLVGRESGMLLVDLDGDNNNLPLHVLVGAYCDVRMILSGQLYMYSTCILDALSQGPDQRFMLAIPETIHVANRRRFERRSLAEFAQVRLWPADAPTPYIGELCNVSADGLACRMIRGDLDELLFVGDQVDVGFDLPGDHESFRLPTIICDKSPTKDGQQLLVGLEFRKDAEDAVGRLALDRLHAALCDLTINSSGRDGEP